MRSSAQTNQRSTPATILFFGHGLLLGLKPVSVVIWTQKNSCNNGLVQLARSCIENTLLLTTSSNKIRILSKATDATYLHVQIIAVTGFIFLAYPYHFCLVFFPEWISKKLLKSRWNQAETETLYIPIKYHTTQHHINK